MREIQRTMAYVQSDYSTMQLPKRRPHQMRFSQTIPTTSFSWMAWSIVQYRGRRRKSIIKPIQVRLSSRLANQHQALQRARNHYEEVKFLENRRDGTAKSTTSSRAMQARRTQMEWCRKMHWHTWARPQMFRMPAHLICHSRHAVVTIWLPSASLIQTRTNSRATFNLARATRSGLVLRNLTAKRTNLVL